MTAVPYALYALNGGGLWTEEVSGIRYDGNVKIGSTSKTASLKVVSEEEPAITASVTGADGDGIVVSTAGNGTKVITATATGEESYAIDATSSGANGVTIKASANTDTQVAIDASATGTAAINGYPLANTAGKFYATGSDGRGVFGRADGPQAYGVYGKAEGLSGWGVFGESNSPSGQGVHGLNTAVTGSAMGIYGQTKSPTGYSGYFGGGKVYISGRLGLGTINPEAKLHISGTSGVDGIKFPDGTLQTTAALGGGGGSLWSAIAGDIFYTAGDVGIGTSSPQSKLHVDGDSYFNGNVGIGIVQDTFSQLHVSTGTLVGIKSSSTFSLAGVGVWGEASASTGNTQGVYGSSVSSDGVGVAGQSPGIGVKGISSGYAGYFEGGQNYFEGHVGIGVLSPLAKLHIGGTAGIDGIRFPDGTHQTTSNPWNKATWSRIFYMGQVGIGTDDPSNMLHVVDVTDPIIGISTDANDATVGVLGQINSSHYDAAGVRGEAVNTSEDSKAIGVHGISAGRQGYGVVGEGETGMFADGVEIGITAWSNSPTAIAAIRGVAWSGGLAGSFSGSVNVTGTLTKGGGSFKIDHPLDPENKTLSHSFVESPDMMNVYNGNIVLDASGQAVVTLPEWFEALNRDFRYQLTAIGAPAPNLYIAEKVHDNHYRIAGGKPGLEVSWQVTGIRKDPWAEANRIPVAEEKTAEEKGYYLHPKAYGKTVADGIDL